VGTPALASIAITPQTVSIYQGTAIQLKATGEHADGSSVDLTSTVAWTSSDSTIATVSAAGLVQSVGLGTAIVTVFREDSRIQQRVIHRRVEPGLVLVRCSADLNSR
jgi:uncharacterized protein YjdB